MNKDHLFFLSPNKKALKVRRSAHYLLFVPSECWLRQVLEHGKIGLPRQWIRLDQYSAFGAYKKKNKPSLTLQDGILNVFNCYNEEISAWKAF